MHGQKMKDKARMFRQPCLYLFPLVHPHIVEDDVYGGDGRCNLLIQMLQKRDEFRLPFALRGGGKTLPVRVSNPANRFKAPLRS